VEQGGSSIYLLSQNGIPLAKTQADLTPLQRHTLILSMNKEAEQKQEAMDGAGAGGGSPSRTKNSLATAGSSSRTFVNTGPDGFDDGE